MSSSSKSFRIYDKRRTITKESNTSDATSTSTQTGAVIITEVGSELGSITYQNFTRVGNAVEATIRYEGSIIGISPALTLEVPMSSGFTNVNDAAGIANINDVIPPTPPLFPLGTVKNYSGSNIYAVVGFPHIELVDTPGGLISIGTRIINLKFNYLV